MDETFEVVNLTGEVLKMVDVKGDVLCVFTCAPEPPPRITFGRWGCVAGLPVLARGYQEAPKLSWVPEQRPGVVYVVAREVGTLLAGRDDCYVPGRTWRDENGVAGGRLDLCRVHPRAA